MTIERIFQFEPIVPEIGAFNQTNIKERLHYMRTESHLNVLSGRACVRYRAGGARRRRRGTKGKHYSGIWQRVRGLRVNYVARSAL